MEGLNVIRNDKWEVTAISMTLYGSDGSPVVTSYDLIPSSVRLFFSIDKYEGVMIGETTCSKVITWNPEADWFDEYKSIGEAVKGQLEDYIGFWKFDAKFAGEFQPYLQ